MVLISRNESFNVVNDVVSTTYVTHKARRVTGWRINRYMWMMTRQALLESE